MDSAVQLFAERGFTATSVEEIADKAGVSKGAVFYNFGNKKALFSTLIDEGLDAMAQRLRDTVERSEPQEALSNLIDVLLTLAHDNSSFARLVIGEVMRSRDGLILQGKLMREVLVPLFASALPPHLRDTQEAPVIGGTVFSGTLVAGLTWALVNPEKDLRIVRRGLAMAFASILEPTR